jgi:hypothetical protein
LETNVGTGFRTIDIYPVYFTKQELQDVEDVLYEKSSILNLISNKAEANDRRLEALKANEKSIYFERLAGKVGLPLDELYKKDYASTIKTKEND